MLTTRQAAERLNVTTQTVRRWYEAGLLTGRQVRRPRGAIKIDEESVQALLDQGKNREESP